MSHPSTEALLALHAGTAQTDAAHVAQCAACQKTLAELVAMTDALKVSDEELDGDRFTAQVMSLVSMNRAPTPLPTKSAWRVAGPVLLALAASLVLFVVANPSGPNEAAEPRARGGGAVADDAWVRLTVHHATDAGFTEVGPSITTDEPLAFGYDDRAQPAFTHLMVFAVDGRGRVFWYEPTFDDVAHNPTSIAIAPGAHALDGQTAHALEPGTLTVHAVFSRRPLDVKAVEAAVARATPGERLPLEGTGQHQKTLRVERPR